MIERFAQYRCPSLVVLVVRQAQGCRSGPPLLLLPSLRTRAGRMRMEWRRRWPADRQRTSSNTEERICGTYILLGSNSDSKGPTPSKHAGGKFAEGIHLGKRLPTAAGWILYTLFVRVVNQKLRPFGLKRSRCQERC